MGKIRVLPDLVASQVAAGEVVERPASVIKELIENSLDAGAGNIEVRVDRGGIALMRVSDDGCGMNREDALLALERHATSKLRTADDLGTIRTLGFRGEALPSIASVSTFTLQTREAHALAGTEVRVEGGKLLDVRDSGIAPGTVIEVRGLFSNVPARRKFLRSENTEFGHIDQTVRVHALAHPTAGFTLVHDGRLAFQLAAGGSLRTRIAGLVGLEVAEALIELPLNERGGLRVWGWVGFPGRSRSDRSLTLIFINGRPVESPVLHYALRTAYGATLARGQHPLCFLFVEMDPAAVDVNVHPSKKEVRFRDGLGVQATLAALIHERLRTPSSHSAGRPSGVSTPARPAAIDSPRESTGALSAPSTPAPQAFVPPPATVAAGPVLRPGTEGAQRKFELGQARSDPPAGVAPATSSRPFRICGRVGQNYALLESEEGLVLMELRAAHERVLYESMRQQLSGGAVPMQPLLVPLTMHLTPRDFALIREHSASLRRLGFAVEEFGANTIKLEALPAALRDHDPAAFLTGLLDDLAHGGESGARALLDLDSLTTAVCARAVPRTSLTAPAEIEALLDRLLACDMPYCDPTGRPTLVQMSFPELARKFGRRP
ncbi:MAG: DNA mismatch repair endonuclease MutL [Verrucomicrobiales bacterium]